MTKDQENVSEKDALQKLIDYEREQLRPYHEAMSLKEAQRKSMEKGVKLAKALIEGQTKYTRKYR